MAHLEAPAHELEAPESDRPLHPFGRFVNPHLDRELAQLKMNKRFVQGRGCHLYDEHGTEYLDCVSSFGALPFGYNPDAIWEAIRAVESAAEPSFAQPARLDAAGQLAERLIELAPSGLDHVTVPNSGAEAGEVAIKLARAATGRPGILSTLGAFHGKTLAALSATGRGVYQEPFGVPTAEFEHIPYGDLRPLRDILTRKAGDFAAFIVEPIQGEGGIVVPPANYLAKARKLCARHGVLLIVDEIQTGLGRSGKLFACDEAGITPDIMLLAKALGGGIMPIGAVLCGQHCYTESFALKHSSTFAGNALACRVGLKTLELLTEGHLVRQVADNGTHLLRRLEALRERHGELVTDVRGRGYMLGIELTRRQEAFGRRCLLSMMAVEEDLAIVVCSHLLNHHRIRTMTTLNGSCVIRVEPPLIATRAQCDQFVDALDEVLGDLSACNSARILSHVAERTEPVPKMPPLQTSERTLPSPAGADEPRFAFVVHPVELRSIVDFDPSLALLDDCQQEKVLRFIQDAGRPGVVGSTRIEAAGRSAYGEFIDVHYTAEDFKKMPFERVLGEVRKAVELAHSRGAEIVGLGGFTSIVSRNGLELQDLGVPLTTGNSYTAVATVEALLTSKAPTLPKDATAVVVGGVGAVGRAAALLLVNRVASLVLVGNPEYPARSLAELDAFKTELLDVSGRTAAISTSVDLRESLANAHFVVSATSSTGILIRPDDLARDAVVCDTSLPANFPPEIREQRPDVTLIAGGIIRVPDAQEIGVELGLDPGCVYGCMAETMMLTLSRNFEEGTVGTNPTSRRLDLMRELAAEYSFTPVGA